MTATTSAEDEAFLHVADDERETGRRDTLHGAKRGQRAVKRRPTGPRREHDNVTIFSEIQKEAVGLP